MEKGYRAKDISRLFGFSEGQIMSWHRSGLVPHVSIENKKPIFGFRELVCFKVMRDLMDKGITPRRMRNYLGQLKRILPGSERPLTELKFTSEWAKIARELLNAY
ncbi:MAG: MerR family transcriptional regulator [Thermodesulfobacteriota bacterium]